MKMAATLKENGTCFVVVNRTTIAEDLLKIYKETPGIALRQVQVSFRGELGVDGGGLIRELYPLFWKAVECDMMDGRIEKIPVLNPKYAKCYYPMGKILSHGYVLTGYLPMCFSSYFIMHLIGHGDPEAHLESENMLIESFLNYVDTGEFAVISRCFDNRGDCSKEDLEHVMAPMLARFGCTTVITPENVIELVKEAARLALYCRPYYALSELRKGMLGANPELWLECPMSVGLEIRKSLLPTTMRVWSMVEEPLVHNSSQSTAFDYLRRLIFSLTERGLALLLRFITGSPHCGDQKIQVEFSTPEAPFQRRPTSNTCGMILYVPTTYSSFSQFSNEFQELLANSHLWSFDFA